MGLKYKVQEFALNQAMNYIGDSPEENLPKLLNWLDIIGGKENFASQKELIGQVLDDPTNNWHRFIMDLWKDIDNDVLKTIFRNFGLNASLNGFPTQVANREKYDCNVPWAMLLDPTSACNLECIGCWAAGYSHQLNMSYETLDSIIKQGKELGTYFYLYSGGEPLVRKADLIRLCEAHPDCAFTAFTNGTLIDEAFADDMLRVKNFVPAISVEGFEADTDFRRGKGTFAKVKRAMALLKERRLPFGISCCYTSQNVEMIGSEEYFDQMIRWGAKFCWFFTYMPVGNAAVPELMVSAKQRAWMYERVRAFRDTKPLFTLDFWNDGEYSQGCLAGGRRYLHINANGDMEPCAFIHYSDSSVYNKTILEGLQSPLFKAYYQGQPFNENHLRPCPMLDNPDALVNMVETSGAHSSDLQSPEDVRNFTSKSRNAAAAWAPVADELWMCSGKCKGCDMEQAHTAP